MAGTGRRKQVRPRASKTNPKKNQKKKPIKMGKTKKPAPAKESEEVVEIKQGWFDNIFSIFPILLSAAILDFFNLMPKISVKIFSDFSTIFSNP